MVRDNLARIRATIARAAQNAGRDPKEIHLVAVSKRVGIPLIEEAVNCGQLQFGENYLQEAAGKIPLFPPPVAWHFIGHLQSNKAKEAAALFTMVETVDRWKVAKALADQARSLQKTLPILIQVNISGEQQKSGVSPEETEALLRLIAHEPGLEARGLMTMPPYSADPEKSRPYFRALKTLAIRLAAKQLFADNDQIELSMGMSGDYPVAIEEGATIVRVGTALFGARDAKGDTG